MNAVLREGKAMLNRQIVAAKIWFRILIVSVLALGFVSISGFPTLGDMPQPELDVPYETTHPEVVETMLKLAKIAKNDVVYDLGCGDGRIVVMAAQKFGARGLGVDLDPQRIKEAKENAEHAGVSGLTQFRVADIFETDLREATVVTLYLLPSVNLLVRPKLFGELNPGTRIVSHAFDMANWEADKTIHHPKARNNIIYLWTIPAPVGGTWQWTANTPGKKIKCRLLLNQEFQAIEGTLSFSNEAKKVGIDNAAINGSEVTFSAKVPVAGKKSTVVYRGTAEGDIIKGTEEWSEGPNAGRYPWVAKRDPVNLVGNWQIKVKSQAQQLDGVLRIKRTGEKLSFAYLSDKEKKEIPISAFYLWGSDIRFDLLISEQEQPLLFRGSLSGNIGAGTVKREGWPKELIWSAQRSESL